MSWAERVTCCSTRSGAVDVLVLAIDTSTAQVSVAFGNDGVVLAEVQLDGGRRHAEQLAPAINVGAARGAVDLADLAASPWASGPGLFTGLRVGVTTAKVMAQALAVPVVGIPSLDLVAYPCAIHGRRSSRCSTRRRREVFAARRTSPCRRGAADLRLHGATQPARSSPSSQWSPGLLLRATASSGTATEFAGARPRGASRAAASRRRASPPSSSWPRRVPNARSTSSRPSCGRCTCAGATPRSTGTVVLRRLGADGRGAEGRVVLTVTVQPIRRRHLRRGDAHRGRCTRDRGRSPCSSPSSRCLDACVPGRAGRELVGYAGMMMTPRRGPRHDDRGRPEWQRRRDRHEAAGRAHREAVAPRATMLTLEVRAGPRARRRCTGASASRPSGCARLLPASDRGRDRHVGADLDRPSTRICSLDRTRGCR